MYICFVCLQLSTSVDQLQDALGSLFLGADNKHHNNNFADSTSFFSPWSDMTNDMDTASGAAGQAFSDVYSHVSTVYSSNSQAYIYSHIITVPTVQILRPIISCNYCTYYSRQISKIIPNVLYDQQAIYLFFYFFDPDYHFNKN